MSETGAQTERLVKARALLQDGNLEESIDLVNAHLLDAPADADALELLGMILTQAGHDDPGDKLRQLSTEIRDTIIGGSIPFMNKAIVKTMFEAAYALTDIRQFDVAAKLLGQCVQAAPDEPVIRYEYAFTLMALRRFVEALPHFEQAGRELNDFDSYLNLGVCHVLTRNARAARASFEEMAKYVTTVEEKKELSHRRTVLKRLEELGNKSELNARDWLYVLYGSILLYPNCKPGNAAEDIKSVAAAALTLRGVLEGLRMEFEVVEYYNPASKPLAKILAELMQLPLDSYRGPDRPDKALLVMAWATDIIGPHQAFIDTSEKRTLFAYGLPWKEPLPLSPDIVGCLADHFPMPWSEDVRDGSVDDIVNKVLQRAQHLDCDPEILKHTQTAVEYYHLKRERLLLGNFESFHERPEYTAEIPV